MMLSVSYIYMIPRVWFRVFTSLAFSGKAGHTPKLNETLVCEVNSMQVCYRNVLREGGEE